MSNFSKFMKQNQIQKQNTLFSATKSLLDEGGVPLLWTIKPISTKENDSIRDDCTKDIAILGKSNLFRPKLDTSKYIARMICASIIQPNLNDKELQDSYGVMTPEDLLKEMVSDPGEYTDLATFVQNFNGFISTMDDKVHQAKN